MLKIEVIRFEAEDVITASVEAPVVPAECICSTETYDAHHYIVYDDDGNVVFMENGSYVRVDHTRSPACMATEHTNCIKVVN